MRSFFIVATFLTTLPPLVAGCSGTTGTTAPGGSPTLALSGTATLTAPGQASQLTATATPAQSSTPNDVSSQATWTSSNTGVATVSATGLVTAVAYGSTTITAVYQGVTSQLTFSVSITGTWASPALDANSNQVTWVLNQTGTNVTGTIGFLPSVPPGYTLSTESVSGSFAGTTLNWTMTFVLSADTARPDCVGQTTTFNGTAQVVSATTMTLTLTGGNTPCDSKQPGAQLKSIGSSVTFTKQ